MQGYYPITAAPFRSNRSYSEIAPCAALKPYIRCFWGTDGASGAIASDNRLVVPDTCMDIIFSVNHKLGTVGSFFCGVDEFAQITAGAGVDAGAFTFGIRFYAWTGILFSERDMRESKNVRLCAAEYFNGVIKPLIPRLSEARSLGGRAKLAEDVLLKRLRAERAESDMMNAVFCMIKSRGTAKISELCGYTAASEKRLERMFKRNTGISPKTLSSLIRYQLLWQEIALSPSFDVLDAVEKYGYTDQPHLLNDFKRRHLMTLKEAADFAEKNR